jgi:hypothetical protein
MPNNAIRTYRERVYATQTLRTLRAWETTAKRVGEPTIVWARAPVDPSVISATPSLTWAITAYTSEELATVPVAANVWAGIGPAKPREYGELVEALKSRADRIKYLYVDELSRSGVVLDPTLDWIVMLDTRAPAGIGADTAACAATGYYRRGADELGKPFFLKVRPARALPDGWRRFPIGVGYPDAGVFEPPPPTPSEPGSPWYAPEFAPLFAEDD